MIDPSLRYKLPKVKEVMSSPVIALTKEHTLLDALSAFAKYGFSALPIVKKEDNSLIGILSEGDCLKYMSRALFYDEMNDYRLQSFVKEEVFSIHGEMDIFQLEELFAEKGIRHAPVVEDGKVVGTVSRTDILKHLQKFTNEVLDHRKDVKEPLELSIYKDFDSRLPDIEEHHRFQGLT